MIKKTLKTLLPLSSIMFANPVMADWPVAVADEFTVHQSYPFSELDLLKNDIGDNLKVVAVNRWSENGAQIFLQNNERTSNETYHNYGDVSYTPKEGFVGQDGFWYVIEDDQGRRNAIRVVVDVKPSSLALPTPLEDFVEVPKNQSIRINALANDLFTNKFTGAVNTFRGEIVDYTSRSTQGGKVEKVEVYPDDTLFFGPWRYGGYSIENTLKYQFKYTPPSGFVGVDTFTYAVRDSKDQRNNEINNTIKWTKVTLNVVADSTIKAPWPVASPDKADLTFGVRSVPFTDINVLKNDIGKNLVLKLNSTYSQKGARVKVVPNHANRPVIQYSSGVVGKDKVWYIIEDEYGRRNFSYVDVTVTNTVP